jgi:DNA repair exonuclease SbcCD ATPase subunit
MPISRPECHDPQPGITWCACCDHAQDLSLALQQSSDAVSMLHERCEEESVRCDELAQSLSSAMSRTVEMENEVQHLRSALDQHASTSKAEASAQQRLHATIVQRAEAMLQEGDAYSRKLYGTLEQERAARLELHALLETANKSIREKEAKLSTARRKTQQAELASRTAAAECAKFKSERAYTVPPSRWLSFDASMPDVCRGQSFGPRSHWQQRQKRWRRSVNRSE